eukprot:7386700-Prymnesium_polylepis.2
MSHARRTPAHAARPPTHPRERNADVLPPTIVQLHRPGRLLGVGGQEAPDGRRATAAGCGWLRDILSGSRGAKWLCGA